MNTSKHRRQPVGLLDWLVGIWEILGGGYAIIAAAFVLVTQSTAHDQIVWPITLIALWGMASVRAGWQAIRDPRAGIRPSAIIQATQVPVYLWYGHYSAYLLGRLALGVADGSIRFRLDMGAEVEISVHAAAQPFVGLNLIALAFLIAIMLRQRPRANVSE